jgi:hypothetical protein
MVYPSLPARKKPTEAPAPKAPQPEEIPLAYHHMGGYLRVFDYLGCLKGRDRNTPIFIPAAGVSLWVEYWDCEPPAWVVRARIGEGREQQGGEYPLITAISHSLAGAERELSKMTGPAQTFTQKAGDGGHDPVPVAAGAAATMTSGTTRGSTGTARAAGTAQGAAARPTTAAPPAPIKMSDAARKAIDSVWGPTTQAPAPTDPIPQDPAGLLQHLERQATAAEGDPLMDFDPLALIRRPTNS